MNYSGREPLKEIKETTRYYVEGIYGHRLQRVKEKVRAMTSVTKDKDKEPPQSMQGTMHHTSLFLHLPTQAAHSSNPQDYPVQRAASIIGRQTAWTACFFFLLDFSLVDLSDARRKDSVHDRSAFCSC